MKRAFVQQSKTRQKTYQVNEILDALHSITPAAFAFGRHKSFSKNLKNRLQPKNARSFLTWHFFT